MIKPTGTITLKATTEQAKPADQIKAVEPIKESAAVTTTATIKAPESASVIMPVKTDNAINPAESIKTGLETVKTLSTTIAPEALPEIKNDVVKTAAASGAEKSPVTAPTKMAIATEIYKRMKTVKGITRKEILDAFVAEAKLSKAGASTYYQLIKANVK
ncbi:MAG: hypothetical protein NVS3B3_03420 [Aquirhabdus sp.]